MRGHEMVVRGLAARAWLARCSRRGKHALPKVRAHVEWEKEVQFNVLVLPRN